MIRTPLGDFIPPRDILDMLGGTPPKYIDNYVPEWHGNDTMILAAVSEAWQRTKKPQDAIPALVDYSEKHLAGSTVGSGEWRVYCQYLVVCKRTSIIPMLIPSLDDKRIFVNYAAQRSPPPQRYVVRTEVYNYLAELTGKPTTYGIKETDKAIQVWIEWWEREGKEQFNQASHTIGNTSEETKTAPAGPFKRIQMTNDTIVTYLPDWGHRWIYKNGTNTEITTYGQILHFRNGDNFQLIEKHSQYVFRAEITNGCGFLHYTFIFDARSFGHGITTTNGIFKAKKE